MRIYNTSKIKVSSRLVWVKENTHIFHILGIIFFIAGLIACFFWMAGKEVEPMVVGFGLVSAIFFYGPKLAENNLPNPKAVSELSVDEMIEFVLTTHPRNDWERVTNNWVEEHFLKKDPKLRFRVEFNEDGTHNENFQEPWANDHPDKRAVSYWYDLFYSGSRINRVILVAVDGGRALIPMPDVMSKKIKTYDYAAAKIHDSLDSLDEYIRRSGLEVED